MNRGIVLRAWPRRVARAGRRAGSVQRIGNGAAAQLPPQVSAKAGHAGNGFAAEVSICENDHAVGSAGGVDAGRGLITDRRDGISLSRARHVNLCPGTCAATVGHTDGDAPLVASSAVTDCIIGWFAGCYFRKGLQPEGARIINRYRFPRTPRNRDRRSSWLEINDNLNPVAVHRAGRLGECQVAA